MCVCLRVNFINFLLSVRFIGFRRDCSSVCFVLITRFRHNSLLLCTNIEGHACVVDALFD